MRATLANRNPAIENVYGFGKARSAEKKGREVRAL